MPVIKDNFKEPQWWCKVTETNRQKVLFLDSLTKANVAHENIKVAEGAIFYFHTKQV